MNKGDCLFNLMSTNLVCLGSKFLGKEYTDPNMYLMTFHCSPNHLFLKDPDLTKCCLAKHCAFQEDDSHGQERSSMLRSC